MPSLRYLLIVLLILITGEVQARDTKNGGAGFVLLQALQRKKSEQTQLRFYCSHTFQDEQTSTGPLHDVYVLKIDPFTRRFETRTRTDSDQSCITEKLETIYRRHSCLEKEFPDALKEGFKLARDIQRSYRASLSESDSLEGNSPEIIQYEIAISSTNPSFRSVEPSIWEFLGWGGEASCNFKVMLRQRLISKDRLQSKIIERQILGSNSF